MHTKLTLRLDSRLIERAKRYAREHNTSLSALVAGYFALLGRKAAKNSLESDPLVESLRGVLKDSGLNRDNHRRFLEKKYL